MYVAYLASLPYSHSSTFAQWLRDSMPCLTFGAYLREEAVGRRWEQEVGAKTAGERELTRNQEFRSERTAEEQQR